MALARKSFNNLGGTEYLADPRVAEALARQEAARQQQALQLQALQSNRANALAQQKLKLSQQDMAQRHGMSAAEFAFRQQQAGFSNQLQGREADRADERLDAQLAEAIARQELSRERFEAGREDVAYGRERDVPLADLERERALKLQLLGSKVAGEEYANSPEMFAALKRLQDQQLATGQRRLDAMPTGEEAAGSRRIARNLSQARLSREALEQGQLPEKYGREKELHEAQVQEYRARAEQRLAKAAASKEAKEILATKNPSDRARRMALANPEVRAALDAYVKLDEREYVGSVTRAKQFAEGNLAVEKLFAKGGAGEQLVTGTFSSRREAAPLVNQVFSGLTSESQIADAERRLIAKTKDMTDTLTRWEGNPHHLKKAKQMKDFIKRSADKQRKALAAIRKKPAF